MGHYSSLTQEDHQAILEAIGVEHFGQTLGAIPQSLRNPDIQIPESLSEHEIRALFGGLSRKNTHLKRALSFLGAGAYEHYIPAAVGAIISRSEFYTSYTPYQAEASQGTLQAIFEYQSLMCELTGMAVSNGSHYDGSTALAEAVLLSLAKTKRHKILVAKSLHPEYRKVIETYVAKTHVTIEEIPWTGTLELDKNALKAKLTDEIACVVIQSPNFFGLVEDLQDVSSWIHEKGALFVLQANPLSFGFYQTPAEYGVDVACGEGQPLGLPPSLGGPWLGYFTTTRELMRQIPGRLVGLTKDSEGRRAFCLTLQAREQHIRREKANSNICTNQALCAVAAAVYLSCLGKSGVRQVAELNLENAYYLRDEIAKLKGFEILTKGSIFNEFLIETPKSVSEINEKLLQRGFFGGLDVTPHLASPLKGERNNDENKKFIPSPSGRGEGEGAWTEGRAMLVCATETKTKEELDQFVAALAEVTK